MLKLLRKKRVSKRIFYCLAAIIIPAFVIWGASGVVNKNKTPNYAGVIFGKKISFDDCRNALYAWRVQMKLQYGDKAEQITEALFDPNQAAWDRLILLNEVQKRKIKISDEEVVSALTKIPFLQKGRKFNPESYEVFLKYSIGQRARTFEEQLRENLAMAEVFKQVTEAVDISEEEIRQEYKNLNESTRLEYVFFPAKGYKDEVSLTNEEIEIFYEGNKENFKIPPQINAAYVAIKFKDDSAEEEKTQGAETLAKALLLSKKNGLQEAAKKLNLKIEETGLFGFEDPIPTIGWMPQFSTLLFNLMQGQMSEIITAKDGLYLFEIIERRAAAIPEFKDVKDKVKETLLNERSEDVALKKAKEFLSKAKGSNLQKAAKEAKLEVKETPLFSRHDYIAELGMAQPLKEVAFKLKPAEVSQELVKLQQGFYAVQSIELVPVDEEKFEEEKEEFSKQLLEQKRIQVFNEFFVNLKKSAHLISYID